jgi:hypothetical protein
MPGVFGEKPASVMLTSSCAPAAADHSMAAHNTATPARIPLVRTIHLLLAQVADPPPALQFP